MQHATPPSHNTAAPAKGKRVAPRPLIHKIMIWIFGPLFLLWTVGIVITYFIAQHIANSPYDRTLRDHLDLLRVEISHQDLSQPIHLSHGAQTISPGRRTQVSPDHTACLAEPPFRPVPAGRRDTHRASCPSNGGKPGEMSLAN
ncbi:hypothetical protein ACI0FT_00913 [Alcaligenes nematophilus]